MTWTANDPIENVTGYKIYYGSASRQYTNLKDTNLKDTNIKDAGFKEFGKVTSCKLEEVITTLVAGKTYYLAATAKSATSESNFSSEIVYTHATVPDKVQITKIRDTDGDGISDADELNLYGTDPTSTDSDIDGISDNNELIYWGALWNEDFDGDGIINLIDWDSDGDGISDGEEITQGTDPATDDISNTQQTVYEDGEDGKISGWDIYDNDPAGASITNVFDSVKQSRVIEVSGYGIQNGFRLRNDDLSKWQNTSQFIAKWSMKFTGNYTIYFNVETTAGQRYLNYTPVDYDRLGTGKYIYDLHHGLGSNSTNGGWITITRNLQQDLQEAQPEAVIIKVNAILIRGNGRIDDISLLNSQTAYENAEDGKISGWDIYDYDPAGASIKNVFDSVKQSRVIEVSGYGIQNGFRLRKDDLSNWQNTSQFIAKWSTKFTGNYTIYIDVETTAGQRYIDYTPVDYDLLGTGQYVHHGLGSNSTNGGWITITRNLQQDLQEAQPEAVIIKVNAILIRGNGRIDDILLQTFF